MRRLDIEALVAERAGAGLLAGARRFEVERQGGQLLGVERDLAGLDLAREARRAAFVRRLRAAVGERDGPVVQRAGDALAEHDALAQRPTHVRAAVEQREHLVLGVAKDRHRGAACALDAARAEHGDVFDLADLLP